MRSSLTAALMIVAIAPAAAQTLVSAPRPGGGAAALRVIEPARPHSRACPPTAIVSRGLGTGENALRYLSAALSQSGYRVIVMRHVESGRTLFQGRLVREGRLRARTSGEADPAENRLRGLELDAAFDYATKSCRPPMLALIGHANGAVTTMIEAGARPRFGGSGKNRFDAYVALSPQGVGRVYAAGAWTGVTRPVLMITGTRDPGEGGSWRNRATAFDGMPPGGKRFAVIAGATHFALGGLGSGATKQKVVSLTSEFLGQVASKSWRPAAQAGVDIREK